MKVLIVEDNAVLAEKISVWLAKENFTVDVAQNGKEANFFVETSSYQAIILDIGLPDENGLSLMQKWRSSGRDEAILILTARSNWTERVEGLNAGADDYLPKPFEFDELKARLSAIIRRKDGRATDKIIVDGFLLNATYRTLTTPDHKEFRLTATEYRLLQCFLRSPDRVFSQDELVEALYNIERCPTRNVVQVYIARLRKILGKKRIKTLRGQGYYFARDSLQKRVEA
ncbi:MULTISPECIES: response regulator transcription factor [Marinobacter]|jgi:DNA-binding response OmpR family regulator|uniref:DNA-binding response regulator n=9 Tax=Marinobacter TaxID=2742 RepID=A0A259VWZ4_9GAMM|nr:MULTISPECIES: response regulator transcription factor [Marinobacter]MCS5644316.1 response regulator transcription factor [Dehalococcoidia bacterium]MEE2762402.1 response regulator transcription factor [Pseudomonadota bacterium]WBU42569.1 response regulator transcription factor [Marinobacter alkaliphilus]AMQ90475.1 DNA-binding response regulator [Marinobacter sp. LQ44]ENO13489.1 DNA-binding response regulator [Marinobacter nanhaiticus D15-8W]